MCQLLSRQMPASCNAYVEAIANVAHLTATDLANELRDYQHTPVRLRVFAGIEAHHHLDVLYEHGENHNQCPEPLRCVATYDQLAASLHDDRPPGHVLIVAFCDYAEPCPNAFFCPPLEVPQ
jgi:hypothetical protein